MPRRRFEAQQSTIVRDLQRVMTKISATSLRIEQDVMGGGVKVIFDRIFNGFLATPGGTALLLGDCKAPWYEILGVKADAGREDVRSAFRALSLVHHPDVGGKEEDFKRLNEAFKEGMKAAKR